MKKALLPLILFTAVISSSLTGCYYDNLEDLYPKDTTATAACDTDSTITYTKHISAIVSNYCISCHGGSAPSGGISLGSYTSVKNVAASGKLLGSVTWDGTASPMPKGATQKIPDCNIEQIKKWIRTSYAQ
jgi:hypothetical protein